ncbi:MAG: GspE/PulE family protein [Candidatus Omnitrophica bacterium]|nr:GspE/PulE family protein [Candidatus Omnitrophota bacterium]MCF7877798.1 GspE/PulE family protein [Candidatus Omnitrophota bacterium]MCF7892169.1 GspE/PulE family protein [Candidatus Omnitrophota bacterium]MCF7895835.1 GspE/PulE family protein [Candidatus Omnitrophota bacterium]MCF7897404.1 GspE/PulE family protein [Candidatus Omnitrophota bacterium]
MAKLKITDYLVERGYLTKDNLDNLLALRKKKEAPLIELIIKLGYIKEQKLVDIFSKYLSIPRVQIKNLKIPKQILNIVPKEIARRNCLIPVSKIGSALTVAMVNPLDLLALEDIKKITGCQINRVVAPFSEIKEAVSVHYSPEPNESLESIIKKQTVDELKIIKNKKKEVSEKKMTESVTEAPVIKFTNSVLTKAVLEKASDLLIEPLEDKGRIRLRIDGVLQESDRFSKKMHPFVISRIKVMCNLNIAEHRLPQEGRFRRKVAGRDVDFRISILPSSSGEKCAIRILDKTTALLNLDSLGIEDDVLKQLKEDSLKPHGLILACGPTGSGKTTSLYSIINHIYTPEKNIVTVEDPVEYQLKGINQVSINPAIGLSFAKCLRSILRQDPDVIMIGEIRDSETADMAIKSALTGHLVLSTLHTTTSAGSVTRLINMGVEPFLTSSTLIGVISQRLVRKLCPKCKQKIPFSDKIIKKYKISNNKNLYRPKGCRHCQHTGYKGRLSLTEYLRVTPSIRGLIDKSSSEAVIKKESRSQGMRTLREDGMVKVKAGITSLEEVIKVTSTDQLLIKEKRVNKKR